MEPSGLRFEEHLVDVQLLLTLGLDTVRHLGHLGRLPVVNADERGNLQRFEVDTVHLPADHPIPEGAGHGHKVSLLGDGRGVGTTADFEGVVDALTEQGVDEVGYILR